MSQVAESQVRNIKYLAYACQRAIVQDYSDQGHVVSIHKTRQGNTWISLDGGRRITIHDALARIESWLTRTNGWTRVYSKNKGV